jgi:hypothetical protein
MTELERTHALWDAMEKQERRRRRRELVGPALTGLAVFVLAVLVGLEGSLGPSAAVVACGLVAGLAVFAFAGAFPNNR